MILPKFVKKTWGWELWFANVDEDPINYCGKLLYVEFQKWSSEFKYHFHRKKDETFFVLEGRLMLDYIKSDGSPATVFLNPNQQMRIKANVKHRFTSAAETGCKFIEASTFHDDDDSYRCEWNEKEGNWKVETSETLQSYMDQS